MAGARDQAARVVRQEPGAARQAPETAEGEAARDAAAPLADQLRTHAVEEAKRRPGDAPGAPPADRPTAPTADAARAAAPQSGKRKKFVMMGVVGLLALLLVLRPMVARLTALAPAGLACPPMDRQLIGTYVDAMAG